MQKVIQIRSNVYVFTARDIYRRSASAKNLQCAKGHVKLKINLTKGHRKS